MDPVVYFVALAVALVLGIGMAIAYSPPTKQCHQCGRRLAMTARTCRYCGYRFSD